MERQAVESSNIASVGHDATQDILEVEFNSGAVWQYVGVPRDLAEKLVKADSVGQFFKQNVLGKFSAQKAA